MASCTIGSNALEIGDILLINLSLSMDQRDLRLWVGKLMEDSWMIVNNILILDRLNNLGSRSGRLVCCASKLLKKFYYEEKAIKLMKKLIHLLNRHDDGGERERVARSIWYWVMRLSDSRINEEEIISFNALAWVWELTLHHELRRIKERTFWMMSFTEIWLEKNVQFGTIRAGNSVARH